MTSMPVMRGYTNKLLFPFFMVVFLQSGMLWLVFRSDTPSFIFFASLFSNRLWARFNTHKNLLE